MDKDLKSFSSLHIDLVVLVILPKLHGQTSNCIEVRAAGVMVLCRGFELLSW